MSCGLIVISFEPAPNETVGGGKMRPLTLEALSSVSDSKKIRRKATYLVLIFSP